MAEARPRQRDEDVGMGRVFWCPVSAVQPTEKRSVHTAPPSDSGQGQSVSCSSRPVPPGGLPGTTGRLQKVWPRRTECRSRKVLGDQRRRNPASLGVTHHYLGSGRALSRRVARRSRQMASPVRNGVL